MIDSNAKKQKTMIRIMAATIITLILFIVVFFVAVPQVNKFGVDKQIEGANFVYMEIINAVQSQGYYSIPVSENETLVLVPYSPQQQTSQTQQPTEQLSN